MSDDLMTMFDETVADGGDSADVVEESLGKNANVHLGDDEVSDTDVSDNDSETDDEDIVSDDVEADVADDDTPEDQFDFDSIKDKTVSVTVNGETFEVPLAELRNGYMRQADYTRKTQQVAADAQVIQWAREMQDAFRRDPAGSIRALQEQFGLLEQNDPYGELDDDFKPIVDELRRTQQELAELKRKSFQTDQERINAEVQTELNTMRSKYSDFDPQEVLPIAIETGLSMEKAYKLWKADRMDTETAAQAEARRKAEEAAKKREAAKAASKKVSKVSVSKAGESDDTWKSLDSFEEIFAYEVEKTRS